MAKAAIVFGVGADAGVGAALCRRFAREGLHVFPSGRTGERIAAVADAIGGLAKAGVRYVADEPLSRAERWAAEVADRELEDEVADVMAPDQARRWRARWGELRAQYRSPYQLAPSQPADERRKRP